MSRVKRAVSWHVLQIHLFERLIFLLRSSAMKPLQVWLLLILLRALPGRILLDFCYHAYIEIWSISFLGATRTLSCAIRRERTIRFRSWILGNNCTCWLLLYQGCLWKYRGSFCVLGCGAMISTRATHIYRFRHLLEWYQSSDWRPRGCLLVISLKCASFRCCQRRHKLLMIQSFIFLIHKVTIMLPAFRRRAPKCIKI